MQRRRRDESGPVRVAVVTGSRAEFGLLGPVMGAIGRHPRLELRVIVAGSHLVGPACTGAEVSREFAVAGRVRMQGAGRGTRLGEAAAVGRGVAGFARVFSRLRPGWVVVLGDRVEAFAAAAAGSIGGIAVAHIHGGDRAEGIADEAMRHAITKLAHVHFPATRESAGRIMAMGEPPGRVHVVGSPAVDGLRGVRAATRRELGEWGGVGTVLLHHPAGLGAVEEARTIRALMAVLDEAGRGDVLALAPNHDPGRETIEGLVRRRVMRGGSGRRWFFCEHLPRARFVGMLKHIARSGGVLAGNSSAGLIEAAALGLRVLNVGPRQGGRERAGNVVDVERITLEWGVRAVGRLMAGGVGRRVAHPYGDGRAGERIARALAAVDPREPTLVRKRFYP